jgi:hypothetical protein
MINNSHFSVATWIVEIQSNCRDTIGKYGDDVEREHKIENTVITKVLEITLDFEIQKSIKCIFKFPNTSLKCPPSANLHKTLRKPLKGNPRPNKSHICQEDRLIAAINLIDLNGVIILFISCSKTQNPAASSPNSTPSSK